VIIRSMPSNDKYRENYDRIFGKKKEQKREAGKRKRTA